MDTLAFCEALTTPILLLDAQGNEFHANTALKRLLELDSEETSSVQICHNLLSRLVDKRGQPVTLNDIRQGGNSDWYLLERSQDFAPIKIRHILMPDGQCLLELQQPEQEKHCQIDHLTGLMNRYQIQALMAEAFATPCPLCQPSRAARRYRPTQGVQRLSWLPAGRPDHPGARQTVC